MSNISKAESKTFPFVYDGWDEAGGDYGDIQFYNVQFVEKFGKIKAGDQFDCVTVYHCESKIVCIKNGAMTDEGFRPQLSEVVVKFKAKPDE